MPFNFPALLTARNSRRVESGHCIWVYGSISSVGPPVNTSPITGRLLSPARYNTFLNQRSAGFAIITSALLEWIDNPTHEASSKPIVVYTSPADNSQGSHHNVPLGLIVLHSWASAFTNADPLS